MKFIDQTRVAELMQSLGISYHEAYLRVKAETKCRQCLAANTAEPIHAVNIGSPQSSELIFTVAQLSDSALKTI